MFLELCVTSVSFYKCSSCCNEFDCEMIFAQDWCIEHGYTNLSPYAGVDGRAQDRSNEEDLGDNGDELDDVDADESGSGVLYDDYDEYEQY